MPTRHWRLAMRWRERDEGLKKKKKKKKKKRIVLQEQFKNKFSQQRCELVLPFWRAIHQFVAL